MAPSIIQVSGIPVDPVVAEEKSATAIRARYGFAVDQPLVSLFGGGLDVERVRLMVDGMLARDIVGTLVVVSGRNTALVDTLAILLDLYAGLVC